MDLKAIAFYCVLFLMPIIDGCNDGGGLSVSNSGSSFSSEFSTALANVFVHNTDTTKFAFNTNGVSFNGSISLINYCFNPTAVEVNGQSKIFDNVRCGIAEYYSAINGEVVERGKLYFLLAFKKEDESYEYLDFLFPDYFPISSTVYYPSSINSITGSYYDIVSSVAYHKAFDLNESFTATEGNLISNYKDDKFSITFPSISYTSSTRTLTIKGSLQCCEN